MYLPTYAFTEYAFLNQLIIQSINHSSIHTLNQPTIQPINHENPTLTIQSIHLINH